jgi:TonB family protein
MHILMMLGMSRSGKAVAVGEELQQISFLDVTYRPEVARIVQATPPGGGGGGPASDVAVAPVPTYATGIVAEDIPSIDLSAALDRGPSQAKIELDRYELDRSGSGMDVVYLGGSGSSQSTDEILAQAPIELSRGGPGGPGSGLGLRGIPGVPQPQAQLSIEHKPLAKPQGTALPQMATQPTPTLTTAPSTGTSFQIAGPISQREISKKVKPRYPKWALQQRISGTVTVRIWVMPNGRIKGAPQVTCSSGYPDLDQVVVEALRLWEFAPLGAGVKSEDQWGDVTFVFQLS